MTGLEVTWFALIIGIMVTLTYVATSTRCGWFGHDYQRVSAWRRTYTCRKCGGKRTP